MDQLREFMGLLKRQHFWFLAPVLLAMGLAGWWLSSKKLSTEFDNNQKQVSGYFSDMQRVSGEQRHPNQEFHDGMETLIQQRRENVRAAWQTKWERQKQELKWPEELPPDFRRQVEPMRPIEKVDPENNPEQEIPRSLRLTYGGFIKKVLPQLAASIGSRWQPARTGRARNLQGFGSRTGTTGMDETDVQDESRIVDWNPTNQGLFDERFDWGTRSPSTREVLYAQEDLWVLATLIDIIRRTNRDAPTRAQAPVKEIDFLQIAKDVQVPRFRVLRPAPLTPDETGEDGLLDDPVDEPTSNEPEPIEPNELDGQTQPDALSLLVQNRYVNENYEPIADLETLLSSVTVAKRIPVRMRLKIDERQIHRLLVECANSPLTFEVRQWRLNPQGENLGEQSFRGTGDSPRFERSQGPAGVKTLPDYQTFVRTVELFGIVYIFNPVDDAILGGTQPENLAADLGSNLPR